MSYPNQPGDGLGAFRISNPEEERTFDDVDQDEQTLSTLGGTVVGDGIIQDQTDAEPTLADLVNVIQGPNARSARRGYVEVETVQPDSLEDDPTDGDTDPEEAEDQFPISSILDYVSPFQPRRSGLRDLQKLLAVRVLLSRELKVVLPQKNFKDSPRPHTGLLRHLPP